MLVKPKLKCFFEPPSCSIMSVPISSWLALHTRYAAKATTIQRHLCMHGIYRYVCLCVGKCDGKIGDKKNGPNAKPYNTQQCKQSIMKLNQKKSSCKMFEFKRVICYFRHGYFPCYIDLFGW